MKFSTIFFKITVFFLFISTTLLAQNDTVSKAPSTEKKWYENIGVRGYAQVRYNRLLETNPLLKNEQGDKSWGENGGFFLRRIRLVFFGQVSKQVYFYIQPDFASSASSGSLNFGQIRDAYIDLGLERKNEFRIRIGQSKIPYGFENMQSSSNRLPLDRTDGVNSAFSNERDLGAFFYWAPTKIRERFSMLVNKGLKGSGDYGVFAFGVFNGQTANKPDANNQLHVVSRFSYPFKVGNQIIEPGIQAYTGKYVVTPEQTSNGVNVNADRNYIDQRAAATFVLYPQPFGIQAEYNVGRGPQYNPANNTIEVKPLNGGYVMLSYMAKVKDQIFIPFTRGHYYNGGKKFELDARSYNVRELEIGIEWQPVKQFELVCQYTISSRRFEDKIKPINFQQGNLLRLQAQLNF